MEYDTETLELSIKYWDVEAVKRHLGAGVSTFKKNPWSGQTAIEFGLSALEQERRKGTKDVRKEEIVELLVKNTPHKHQLRAFYDYAGDSSALDLGQMASKEVIKHLSQTKSLLFTMASNGWVDNLRLLIENGADVWVRADNEDQRPLLHVAVDSPGVSDPSLREEMVELILAGGERADCLDAYGRNVLFFVRDARLAEVLVKAGARADCVNRKGQGVLMGQWNTVSKPECVAYLIQAGARIEQGPARESIEKMRHVEIADVLLSAWKKQQLEKIGGVDGRGKSPRSAM